MDALAREVHVQCNLDLSDRIEAGRNKPKTRSIGHQTRANIGGFVKNSQTQTDSRNADTKTTPENSPVSSSILDRLKKKIKSPSLVSVPHFKTISSSKSVQCGGIEPNLIGTCVEQAVYVLKSSSEFCDLDYQIKSTETDDVVMVTKIGWFGTAGGSFDPVVVTVNRDGKCTIQVAFKKVKHLDLKQNAGLNIESFCDILRQTFKRNMFFCQGIDSAVVNKSSVTVQKFVFPSARVQSTKCRVQFEIKPEVKRMQRYTCIQCRYASWHLRRRGKRKAEEGIESKIKRTRLDSKCPIQNLTPKSKRKRMKKIARKRQSQKSRINMLESKLKDKDFLLSDEQSKQMEQIVNTINTDFSSEIESTINEVQDDAKETLLAAWNRDSQERHNNDRKNFFHDQQVNVNSNRQNKWSSITYRIALAIFTRSRAAYQALRSFNILQLPSVGSLQSRTSIFLNPSGVNQEYMRGQAELYRKHKEEKVSRGEVSPKNIGVLIFDETKVIDKVMWNSKNHEFVGVAMTEKDFPHLFDICTEKPANSADTPIGASYVLQFLWRDLTSDFDVIGPYFMCHKSLEHKFLMGCVFETLRYFEAYSFHVKCMVCDGASENLALIKTTMGHKGVFGHTTDANGNKDFAISPSFDNPYFPGEKIHWIICPSHQLKNMVGQLYASRVDGPKDFSRNGTPFGWKNLIDLKHRDDERFEAGQLKYVPNLLQSYLERDSWTRLNVKPSKIMQQEQVLGELLDYSRSGQPDSASARKCYDYLRSLNLLFEKGFLNKLPVRGVQSDQLQNIDSGYSYFEEWITDIYRAYPDFNANKSQQTKFISWQTWDLLRVCVYGVRELIADFCPTYPENFLVLSRINGSAVESLFSQFKYAAGSKLSSVNYHTARKAVIAKTNVHGNHFNNRDYRNVPLYIRD